MKTEIYQHNKLQRGPILKESECTVITTASGFTGKPSRGFRTPRKFGIEHGVFFLPRYRLVLISLSLIGCFSQGDSLHLGVDLYASEPLKDGDGSRKGEGENRGQELLFQKEVIIIQTNLMLTRLRSHLETLEFEIERKREFLADQTPSFRVGIERLKWKLFKKCEAIAWKELSKQMKLVEKEYTRQLKFLRKLCEIETEARRKETRATEKYRQKQIKLYAEMAKRKGEYAKNNWRPISEIVGEENLDQDRELLATLDCSKDSETHETLCEVAGIVCKAVNPEPEAEKSSSCN